MSSTKEARRDNAGEDSTITTSSSRKRSRITRSNAKPLKKQRLESEEPETSHTLHGDQAHDEIASTSKPYVGTGAAVNARSTHVRFESEEPQVALDDTVPSIPAIDREEELDSDDEAPEDISATVASKATQKTEAAVAEAIKQQQSREKKRRQKNTARLEAQVRTSERRAANKDSLGKKIRRKGEEENIELDSNTLARKQLPTANDESDEEDVPELLPEDVLMEVYARPPTPPPLRATTLHQAPKSSRKLDFEKPKVKDRRVGPVNVSVLAKDNKHLAPRASKDGRGIRENWLAGRSGKGGAAAVERKPFNTKFITR